MPELTYGLFMGCEKLDNITFLGTISQWNSLKKASQWRAGVPATSVTCYDGIVELGNYDVDSNGNFTVMDKSKVGSVFEVPAVVDGKTVTGLGNSCFEGCSELEELTIPSTVTFVDYYCFLGCNNLRVINGTENIEIVHHTYIQDTQIESLDLSGLRESQGGYPKSLKTVVLSNKLEAVPNFQDCEALETIVFNGTVSEWNRVEKTSRSFRNVPATYVTCSDGTSDISGAYSITSNGVLYCLDSSSLPSVYEIPSEINGIAVKSFSNSCFEECYQFTSVVVPEGVTSFGWDTFRSCKNLVEISLPSTLKEWGPYAFLSCEKLESISIPSKIKSIPYAGFSGCSSLSSVSIPEGLTMIDNDAFQHCYALRNIIIPDTVTRIGGSAFAFSGLQSIELPNSVKTLEGGVFQFCENLESVVISGNVTEIPSDLFRGDTKLEVILFNGTAAKWNSLNKGSGWNAEVPAEYVVCTDGVVYIRETGGLFTVNNDGLLICSDCSELPYELIIPSYVGSKKVEGLADNTFKGSALTSVKIPEGVKSIGTACFENCVNLSTVSFPSTLKTIWHYAFIFIATFGFIA